MLFDFKEFYLVRHINVHVLSDKEERMKEMAALIVPPIKQPEKPLVCAILYFTALISLIIFSATFLEQNSITSTSNVYKEETDDLLNDYAIPVTPEKLGNSTYTHMYDYLLTGNPNLFSILRVFHQNDRNDTLTYTLIE